MNMLSKLLYLPVFLALSLLSAASAADANEAFATHLYEKGEYRWAIVEFERLIFTFPDSSAAPAWHFRTGLCNLRERRFAPALAGFERAFGDRVIADSARLFAAECALRLHFPPDTVLRLLDGSNLNGAALFSGYAAFCAGDYPAAQKKLSGINDSTLTAFKARSLEKTIADASAFSPKHYAPALLLGLVPGLGHVYAGRYGDAAYTATTVLTGACITGYYAWHGARPQTTAAGIITGLFYAGGIYGGIVSVKIHNASAKRGFRLRAEGIVLGQ